MKHNAERYRETLIHHKETDLNYECWECGSCGAIFEAEPEDEANCPKCGARWKYEAEV